MRLMCLSVQSQRYDMMEENRWEKNTESVWCQCLEWWCYYLSAAGALTLWHSLLTFTSSHPLLQHSVGPQQSVSSHLSSARHQTCRLNTSSWRSTPPWYCTQQTCFYDLKMTLLTVTSKKPFKVKILLLLKWSSSLHQQLPIFCPQATRLRWAIRSWPPLYRALSGVCQDGVWWCSHHKLHCSCR